MIVEIFYDLEKSLSVYKHEKLYYVRSVEDLGDKLMIVREIICNLPDYFLKKDEIKRIRIL